MPYTEGSSQDELNLEGGIEDVTPPPEGAEIPTAEHRQRLEELEASLKKEADEIHELGAKAPQQKVDNWIEKRKEADELKESIRRGWMKAA